ncbi:hypothetical protein [Emticicia fontis]
MNVVNKLLEKALEIARAHSGQVDKAGSDYLLHPLRVMQKMQSDEEKMVALLHDVVEDSALDKADLTTAGFSEPVCNAVERLTRKAG